MSQPVSIANRPITFDDIPLHWIDADLEPLGGGFFAFKTAQGYYEVHGDGSVGFAADSTGTMSHARKDELNTMVFPAFSDRQDGLAHPTFKVAYRER